MKEKLSIILLSLVILFIATPLVSAAYVQEDGLCSYDEGETRHNSPADCKVTATQYMDCLKDKSTCPDESVWNEMHYFMGALILLLLYIRHQRQSKSKIMNKRKRKSYTDHLQDVGSRKKQLSGLRFRNK